MGLASENKKSQEWEDLERHLSEIISRHTVRFVSETKRSQEGNTHSRVEYAQTTSWLYKASS